MSRLRIALGLALLGSLLLAATAGQASQTCREWWREHESWRGEVLALYLSDASQRELDEAMFELMQLEAYLTACEGPAQGQRARLVAHRTIERPVDEYAAVVPESLLEQAGFDLSLDSVVRRGALPEVSLAPGPDLEADLR